MFMGFQEARNCCIIPSKCKLCQWAGITFPMIRRYEDTGERWGTDCDPYCDNKLTTAIAKNLVCFLSSTNHIKK